MNRLNQIKIASVGAILAVGTCLAQASGGLDGSLVNVSAYYPTTSSVYDAGGNTVVTGAVEYPTGSFPYYNPGWQVDITDTQIIISDAGGFGFPYAGAPFNGWVLTILSGPVITSAAVDPSSQFDPVGISIVGGNQLFLNYSGVGGEGVESSIIDINSGPVSTPDGGLTVAMLGAVMSGLALIRRKF